jgi:DNA polymerase-3 subunit gamma/tau
MVLVRLAYVADLPPPAELVKALTDEQNAAATGDRPPPTRNGNGGAPARLAAGSDISAVPRAVATPAPSAAGLPQPQSFLEVLALFNEKREALLRSQLWANVHLVSFEPGRIELRPTEAAPRDLANRLSQLLGEWTGRRWVVSVSREPGMPTLKEQAEEKAASLRSEAAEHPLVRAVLDTFPGARIEAVRDLAPVPADPQEPSEGEEA